MLTPYGGARRAADGPTVRRTGTHAGAVTRAGVRARSHAQQSPVSVVPHTHTQTDTKRAQTNTHTRSQPEPYSYVRARTSHTHARTRHALVRAHTNTRALAHKRTTAHTHIRTYTGRRLALRCVRERDPPQVHAAPLARFPRARGGGGGAARARRRRTREGQLRVRRPVAISGNGRRAPRRPWPAGTGPM